jgi:hypothetical protein
LYTAVRLRETPTRCSLAFGQPIEIRPAGRGHRAAIFDARRLVGYLVQQGRRGALYIFRTSPPATGRTKLAGVFPAVDLLCVASTERAIRKLRTAVRFLERRIGTSSVDTRPDLFWLRFAEIIAQRGRAVIPYVTELLARDAEFDPPARRLRRFPGTGHRAARAG